MTRGALLEASQGLPPGTTTVPATWVTGVGGNDVYWRVKAPCKAVGGKLALVKEKVAGRAFTCPNRDTALPWQFHLETEDGLRVIDTAKEWKQACRERVQFTSMRPVFPTLEGAVIFTRPGLELATLASHMAAGTRTVAENDDSYFTHQKNNLFLRQTDWADRQATAHAKAMASMDANVFSTGWLRDRYWREYRERFGKTGLPEMFVCRNNVPRSDWPDRDQGDGRVRVGFMGSNSHVWDVNIAYTAIHAAKQFGRKVETVMIGYNPGDPDPNMPDEMEVDGETIELRNEKSRLFRDKWAAIIDRAIPWVASDEYHRAALPLDIGLAPLRTDEFTLGKSDVKNLEYTISGAAVVCQNMPVYNTAGWVHEKNCLMAGSQREMAEQVVRLIRDPGLRYELVSAAQDMVWNERNEDVMRDEWMAAIDP